MRWLVRKMRRGKTFRDLPRGATLREPIDFHVESTIKRASKHRIGGKVSVTR